MSYTNEQAEGFQRDLGKANRLVGHLDGKLKAVRELLGLESHKELDHVLECPHCDLWEGGVIRCDDFRMVFEGYQPAHVQTREEHERGQMLQAIWGRELIFQALPVLRHEGFADRIEVDIPAGSLHTVVQHGADQ